MRKCSKCGKELPIDMFYKDKSKKDGLQTYCKDCAKKGNSRRYFENKEELKIKRAKYYAENKERISKQNAEYRLKNIEKVKEQQSQWYIDNKEKILEYQKQRYQENKEEIKSKVAQYNREHKEEIAAYDRQYYQKNKEKLLAYQQQYLKTEKGKAVTKAAHHKRRIAKSENGGSFSADEWINVCVEFGKICAYCGKEDKLTADHIIPVSKGGTSNINNIVPACQSCNSSKHNYDLEDWYPRQPFFMPERFEKIIEYSK